MTYNLRGTGTFSATVFLSYITFLAILRSMLCLLLAQNKKFYTYYFKIRIQDVVAEFPCLYRLIPAMMRDLITVIFNARISGLYLYISLYSS